MAGITTTTIAKTARKKPCFMNDSEWDANNEKEQWVYLQIIRGACLDYDSFLKDEFHPLALASIIAYDGSMNMFYDGRPACSDLLERDETCRRLLFEAIRTKKWSLIRRYPAFKIHILPEAFEEALHEQKGATLELFLEFEKYRISANSPDAPERSLNSFPRPLWLTVSLVRHAEARSNVDPQWCDEPDPLTAYGQEQLAELTKDWADVSIDAIYSSDVIRTRETAAAIVGSRSSLSVDQCHDLIEQDHGPVVRQYVKEDLPISAYVERTGKEPGYPCWGDAQDRAYRPSGGESSEDVARRAQVRLLRTLLKHGIPLDDPPLESTDKFSRSRWGVKVHELPKDVPHVVIVSHNLFLTELYESILCWDHWEHKETRTEFCTAEWSRHLIRIDWPHDIVPPKYSYREKWFGLRLQMWNLKPTRQRP